MKSFKRQFPAAGLISVGFILYEDSRASKCNISEGKVKVLLLLRRNDYVFAPNSPFLWAQFRAVPK